MVLPSAQPLVSGHVGDDMLKGMLGSHACACTYSCLLAFIVYIFVLPDVACPGKAPDTQVQQLQDAAMCVGHFAAVQLRSSLLLSLSLRGSEHCIFFRLCFDGFSQGPNTGLFPDTGGLPITSPPDVANSLF